MKIYPDQHVHCHFSADTDEPMENYINKAEELGLESFTFTNHFDYDFITKGNDLIYNLDDELKEIEKLSKGRKVKVLRGIEMGYDAERMDEISKVISSNNFDVVNYSLHCKIGMDYFDVNNPGKVGIDKFLNSYFTDQVAMVKAFKDYDVFCHIDFGFKTAKRVDKNQKIQPYMAYLSEIMSEIIKNDKVLEINTKVQETINDEEHVRFLLRLYKSLGGVNLSLSSDAHRCERLYSNINKYMQIIKEEGFDHLCYFIKRQRFNFSL